MGAVSHFEYTHFDLLTARTGPDGVRYEFTHDDELRLTGVTGPQGLAWSYQYDAAGNIVSETDFDGRTLAYRVDSAGQLTTRIDAMGGVISFLRDQLGQVVQKDVDGRLTAYSYDEAGRLLDAVGPDGELRYQYDRLGQVKTELVNGCPLVFAYDDLGRRTRRITPTGHVTSYAYRAGKDPGQGRVHAPSGETKTGEIIMKLTFDDNWLATVTADPLNIFPGFTGKAVHVACYTNAVQRERFLADTFGSQELLWDTPDVLRFNPASQQLVGLEFHLPEESASAEASARLPGQPARRPGGLRADEAKDFRHRSTTVLCRAPGDAALTCLRDLDVLAAPFEARVEIAPDLALVVQHSNVVGWSLTNPVQYLTTGFAEPDPGPPPPPLTDCSPSALI